MTRPALAPEPVTAASVLALVQAVERHGPDAPAAIAFRSALARKGREIAAADGPAALGDMLARIHAADPARAAGRSGLLHKAWGDLLPTPVGRVGP